MISSPLQGVVNHARMAAVLVGDGSGPTDAQLLTRFVDRRDEDAFEALLRRHGPMVLGVCQRVLHAHHDAEDAFQATFLVLVRKAASIVPREMVSNWLYGVAHTTAVRVRVLANKRRAREKQVFEMPQPPAARHELWNDLQPIIDQELSRLPDKYRVAIVLCDLQGKSHKEAARQLGWPIGSLSGRLSRGRKILAARLARHGLAVSSGALAGVLSQSAASASVPVALVSSTMKAASVLAAGQAAVGGLVSAQVAALTEGIVMTMQVNKIKTAATALLFTALVGGAGLLYGRQAATPSYLPPSTAAAQAPKDQLPSVKDGLAEATPPLETNEQSADGEKQESSNLQEPAQQSEKNELPTCQMPRQALVSLNKDRLAVRTLSVAFEPISTLTKGRVTTSYQKVEMMTTRHYELESIKVYDVKGKRVGTKELSKLLKKEMVAGPVRNLVSGAWLGYNP